MIAMKMQSEITSNEGRRALDSLEEEEGYGEAALVP